MTAETTQQSAEVHALPEASARRPVPFQEISEVSPAKPSRTWSVLTGWLLPGAIFWVAAIVLQILNGAYQHEFGGHPDEASHYVTGLLVHDFLASGDWTQPMSFADDFYNHYPRVSLGHWPPFFYFVQALWTLPLGTSRFSVMLLMALVTALTSLTLFRCLRGELGVLTAGIVSLLYATIPLVQLNDSMLMADTFTGLLCFWAALCYGRYLETGTRRSAAAFGLLAVLAIMSKGSGLVLVLVPPLGVLFARRLGLMKKTAFWLPAVLVVLLCGPWYWLTRHMTRNGLIYSGPTLEFTIPALAFFSVTLVQALGIVLFLVAAVGFVERLALPALREGAAGKWAACGALLVGVWTFDCVVPVNYEKRYMISSLPPLLMFLAAGMGWLGRRAPLPRVFRPVLVGVAVMLVFALETFVVPSNASGGCRPVAEELATQPELREAKVLVSSDPLGEGMFVAAVAEREQRPGHVILRGSKVLSQSDWMGFDYQSFVHTPAEMMQEMERLKVDLLVLDTSAPPTRYLGFHQLLKETVAAYPQAWQVLSAQDVVRQSVKHAAALRVYRRVPAP
jgi:hypothetical protein